MDSPLHRRRAPRAARRATRANRFRSLGARGGRTRGGDDTACARRGGGQPRAAGRARRPRVAPADGRHRNTIDVRDRAKQWSGHGVGGAADRGGLHRPRRRRRRAVLHVRLPDFARHLDGAYRATPFQFAVGTATFAAAGLLYLTFRPYSRVAAALGGLALFVAGVLFIVSSVAGCNCTRSPSSGWKAGPCAATRPGSRLVTRPGGPRH